MTDIKMQHKRPEPNPNEIVDISVEQLLLDSENPRFAGRIDANTQDDLVKIMWTEMAVNEVAWSIAENAFFRSEPLLVIIKNPNEKDLKKLQYIVVEGNRRLTAVFLLRNKKLREKVGATNLPEISEERRAGLDELPAIIYAGRKELWEMLGFRHISGVMRWDSFSKAKYIAQVRETYGVPLTEIAEKIGDQHATVKRMYRGYKILEQAESQAGFDKEDAARGRFYFSHLYTAADQKEFQEFLGIDPNTSLRPNPVPESRLAELGQFMTWLYGKKSEEIEPVVRTQNPDLNTLRRVISKPDSLSALQSGHSLELSYAIAIGDRRRFRDALTSTKVELQNAKATVTTGYNGEKDLYDTILDIVRLAETIRDEMETQIEIEPTGRGSRPLRRKKG